MGAATSSARRDSRGEEDAAAEELTAAGSDAPEDGGAADDKLLQTNGQISNLNAKTKDPADEINCQFEDRVLADVGSGFVTLKEDGTETLEDLQNLDSLQPNAKNDSSEMVNAGVNLKEETEVDNQVNDINEVGFKRIFRFVGFKLTLKKDTCEKTQANEQKETEENELKEADASEDAKDEDSDVAAIKITPYETHKIEVSSDAAEPPSQQTDNETEPDQDIKIVDFHVVDTPGKEMEKESSLEPEEPMSPIKQFFTQGIFASLRKKKKEEEIQKESKEEELKENEKKIAEEEAEKQDSKCMCLDIPYIISEEGKDSQEKGDDSLLPEGELQNSLEKDRVQGSPLKRLFRKFSSRRQREGKAVEKVVEVEEQVSEQPKPSSEVTELGKAEEPLIGEPIIEEPTVREPKPADEEPVGDVGPQESKKKSDTTVSWEALICGGSAKKRARKTNENEMTGQEHEKVTDSPLGSSIEGDYDHLTSSNEQTGSPAEGEVGSTWKTFKKMVTPKRKVRPGESSTPEQIPSDGEMSKDESFSMKKLIPGHKKRKSEAKQDQTSSDEAAKDHESDDEDDETPAIIPLSEYEVIEPETLKEMNEQRVEITIEHEMPEIPSQALEKDTFKIVAKVSSNTAPAIIQSLSEDFEELTDFLSKHQQLSDIPEEGIIEESIETPVSSAEWTTQDDTLAEDIVELTADAVTAPEPESFFGDDTTEMVSALSQLTESPRSSGHVTPMSAEYDVQTSDAILHEAIQSICMTPSVQSVTTKDESKKTLAVSFSPYIVQSSTPEETKVLVAHKKTEATAICIGLVSQEIESVEKHLPAPLVEAILEVCDTVPTELASDNFTDELEVARFGTDEVYEAEIKNVKTEFQEMIVNEKQSTTESEQDRVQVIQLVTEPLVDESEETHIQDKKEESTTGIELRRDIDTKQSESGLDQVMSDNTHGPEMECPACSADEFECNQLAAAEATLDTLSQVVEQETVNKNLDITKATDAPVEDTASAVECPEIKENVNIISPITDQVQVETIVLEDSLQIKDVPSIQADVKDADLSVEDSGDMSIKDIGEKMEASGDEKITQQEIKEDHLEEETGDVVSSEVVQNVETENISESIDDLLVKEQLPAEKALTEPVFEKVEEAHKEVTVTDVDDNKVADNAHDRADRIFVKDELALKYGQPLTDTESNETEYQDLSTHLNSMSESPDIAVGETEKGETEKIIPVVSEFSKDVLESTKTPTEREVSCEAIPTILGTPSAEVEVKPVPEDIVIFQTEECSQDTQQNEQLQTSENNKTGKVLEMVAIIEKTTKQLEQEKGTVAEPEAQVLTMSELPKATEQEGDSSEITVVHGVAKDSDQAPAVTLTDTIRTAIPDEKYKEAVAPILKPERVDSRMTVTEENKANADSMQKCEPLRQITEMTLSKELQVDKADNKDEIPAVTEVIPKEQVPPLRSEVTAEMPDVTVSEVQTKVESALRAATLEVTEPKVEMPVVTEVTVESAVVTELEVERPIVTSVVAELEVETPVVTSTTKTTDTHTSQIIDADTTELTTVIKEHVEKPTVISVVVTPATPLDEVAPVLTQSHESRVLDEVKDVSVEPRAIETPKVESVIVRTVVAPVVEIQNVIPVVTAPNLGSIIMTEGSSPVVEATVLETTAATAVKPDVVEIPVVQTPDIDSVITSPAITSVPSKEVTLDLTSFTETPLDNVTEIPVVSLTSVKPTVAALMQTTDAEIQARVPMTVTEAACPVVVTTDVTPVVPGRIVIPVLETPHATSSTVVLQTPTQMSVTVTEAEAPITTSVAVSAVIPVEETVRVTETSPPGVVSVTAAVETPATIPVVQTPTVKLSSFAMVETPVVTPVVLMPKQVSEKAKETALSAVISAVETPSVIPAEGYPVVKLTQVAVVEAQAVHPMAETPGQGLVQVTEASPPAIVSDVTAAVETPAIISVVETPVVMATPVTNFELPVVTPVVEILGLVSEIVKETAPPTVVSAVETLPVITVVQTPTVKSTEVPVVEPPVVKLDQVSSLVSETSPPLEVSAVEAPAIIPVVETQVVKSTPVAVIEMPVVTPVVQIPGEVSVMVKETAPPAVVSAVETSAVMTVIENLVLKSTPVSVLDAPAVTPVVQTSCQGSARVIEPSPLPVVSGVTAAVEAPIMIPVVETPVVMDEIPIMTKVIQTPSQDLVMVKETAPLVIVSAVETRLAIPVVETPTVTSTQLGVVEATGVLPAVQAIAQDSVRETETLPQAIISGVTAAVEVPSMIPVVDIPVAVVEIPVVPPVVQAPGQGLVRVSETSPPSVVLGVTAPVETPAMIPAVETLVVKSPVVAVVETPVVTPVEQTAGQVSGKVKEIVPPADASAVTSREETPAVNSTPVAVVQPPVLTPVVEIPEKVSMKVTETSPPAVAETSVLAAVVETAVVKAAPSAVTETPVLTPVVQISEQVSMRVTETSSPVGAETTVLTQVVETSVVKPAPAAVTETPILTPVVQISEQVSVKVTETSPPSVTKTAVLTPVVETPVTKPAAVTETPVMTPMVQSPRQVLVTVTETALPVFASAEKPVVVPVETPVLKPTLVAETPVMTTPILTSVVERSVLSLVLETTAPTTIALTERPVMIPMVQTPALVSVIVKETAPPVVLPPVTTTAEIPVKSPAVETLAVKPTSAVTETPIPVVPITESPVVTPVGEQVAQTPTTPATASVKTPPIGTVMETPAVVSEEKAKQQTEVAEALTLAPVVEAPATPQPVVTPDVKEAIVQVVAEDIKKANTEPSVVFEDAVQQHEVKTSIQKNPKGPMPHEAVVTSTEPQPEIEEDVWEDAVDNIGDSPCQLTHTEDEPQDTAAKQASEAVI